MPASADWDQAAASGQFADVGNLFFHLWRAAGFLDGGIEIGLLAQTKHCRMFRRDGADVPIRTLTDLGDCFLGGACLLYTSPSPRD